MLTQLVIITFCIVQIYSCDFLNDKHEYIFEQGCIVKNPNWDGTEFDGIKCVGWDKLQSKDCASSEPSGSPSIVPTNRPSISPSYTPSLTPTTGPTSSPSLLPSLLPSSVPSSLPTYISYLRYDCDGNLITRT